ncbi:LuxR C-terminal-related transcriptional regulator [Turicimonas muris]|uniref:LuxR C-terminal-related transcriptional regulator n=1 Tax=Turicimonas muris TaxID=1796652 RepID=UPI00349E6EA6
MSPREREVAVLLAQGLLYKQIADRLGCSERTVKFHKARIAEKLGVKTSVEIALKLSALA